MLVVQIQVFGQTPYGLDYKTFPTDFSWVQDTIYIDPSFGNGGDGTSPASPFNELSDFTYSPYKAYLFQRNDTLTVTTSQSVWDSSVFFGAYGTGAKPVIISDPAITGHLFTVHGDSTFFQNIEFIGADTADAISATALHGGLLWVDSVEAHGFHWGISSGEYGKAYITNCYVHYTQVDGIYTAYNDTIIVYNTYVHDVNRWYPYWNSISQSGGDCIQSESDGRVVIDSCRLDHSDYIGKFSLIINGSDTAVVVNNYLDGWNEMACVYHGSSTRGWHYNGNTFTGGDYGTNIHSKYEMFNCVFYGLGTYAIYGGSQGNIENVTVYNTPYALAGAYDVSLKNSIIHTSTYGINQTYNQIKAYNNCYYNMGGTQWGYDNITSDPLLTNPASNDFTLQLGSPCIDVGKQVHDNGIDKDKNLRPYNGAWDIGAYEYGATSTSDNSYVSDFTINSTFKYNVNGISDTKTGWINGNGEAEAYLRFDTLDFDISYGALGLISGKGYIADVDWDTVANTSIYLNQFSASSISFDFKELSGTYYNLKVLFHSNTDNGSYSRYSINGVTDSIITFNNDSILSFDSISPSVGTISFELINNSNLNNVGYISGLILTTLDNLELSHCDTTFIGISEVVTADTLINSVSQSKGAIDITVSNGTPPYSYNWDFGAYSTEDIAGIQYGSHNVQVMDDSSCINSKNINIPYINQTTGTDTVIVDSVMINFTSTVFSSKGWINWVYGISGPVNIGGTETIDILGDYATTNTGSCVGNGVYPDTVLEYTWYETIDGFDIILTLDDMYIYDIKAYACRADYPSFEMFTQYKIGNDSIELYIENNTDTAHFKNKITDINSQITMNVNSGPSATGGSGRLTFLKVIRKEIVASDNRILFNLNNNTYKDSYFGKNLIINLNQ